MPSIPDFNKSSKDGYDAGSESDAFAAGFELLDAVSNAEDLKLNPDDRSTQGQFEKIHTRDCDPVLPGQRGISNEFNICFCHLPFPGA